MDNTKIKQIIRKIHKKSLGRELQWKELGDDKFQVAFPNSSISIGNEIDEEVGEPYLSLSFYNNEGTRIMEIFGRNIVQYIEDGSYKVLEEIYGAAKESILKTDETIDDILDSLEKGHTGAFTSRIVTVSSSASLSPSTSSSSSTSTPTISTSSNKSTTKSIK
jgi:hypothetical protein